MLCVKRDYQKDISIKKENKMSNTKITLPIQAIRTLTSLTDKNVKEYYGYISCKDLAEAEELPDTPNPRKKVADKSSYQELVSAITEKKQIPDLFMFASLGIHILADSAVVEDDSITITLSDEDGIVNGGHLYGAIRDELNTIPKDRFVRVFIMTGVKDESTRLNISIGLNNSLQVSDESLLNHKGQFQWIKDAFKNTPYEDAIVYFQGDDGTVKVRDIISTVYSLIKDGTELMIEPNTKMLAYGGKNKIVDKYEEQYDNYKKFKSSLKDIYRFKDYVQETAYPMWCDATGETNDDNPFIFSAWKNNKNQTLFIDEDKEMEYVLHQAVLVPVIASFRTIIAMEGKFNYHLAKKVWDNIGFKLMQKAVRIARQYDQLRPVGYFQPMWEEMFEATRLELKSLKQNKLAS
jgi:hypothetical protein